MKKVLFLFALALGVSVNAQIGTIPTAALDSVDVYSADSLTAYCRVANGGDTTTYGIFEVKDAGNVVVFVSDSILFDTIAGLFNYSFTLDSAGLLGDTTYTMSLTVQNGTGSSTTGSVAFVTPIDPGPPVIESIETSNVFIDSASIVVNTSTADSADLILRWRYQASGPYIGQLTASVINAEGTTFPLSGLFPDTTIYLYVEISNAAGIDVKLASFTTLPPINSTVTTGSILSIDTTSIEFECSCTLGTGVASAELGFVVDDGSISDTVFQTVTASGIYSGLITGLLPGTTYTRQCVLADPMVYTGSIQPFVTDTLPAPPPVLIPFTVSLVEIGNDSVFVTTTADTVATAKITFTAFGNGCNSNTDYQRMVPRGTFTFGIAVAGADSVRVQVELFHPVDTPVFQDDVILDLGPVNTFDLNVSTAGYKFQNNQLLFGVSYDIATQIYDLTGYLYDQNQNVIETTQLIYQPYIEFDSDNTSLVISDDYLDLGGTIYFSLEAEPRLGVGLCGDGMGFSDLVLLPQKNTGPTAIRDRGDAFEFSVYPNPSQGLVTIRSEEAGTIKLIDLSGKIVLKKAITEGDNRIEFDVAPGMYVCTIASSTNTVAQSIIIQ